ncbi:Probable protease sohB [Cedecea neteri]|uniref:Probable protease sohB n=1 Tax=Cedecea neteri TaxID=158822 RepID=A0A2X3J8T8_9ENTR|nr:Probable protease sohB [Cedecea neteri]
MTLTLSCTPQGSNKRTLTLLGENTEQGVRSSGKTSTKRIICSSSLSAVCVRALILKRWRRANTGTGTQAKEKGLVDEVSTSDDLLLGMMKDFDAINVRYLQRKKVMDRFTGSAANSLDRLLLRWWQRGEKPLL